MRAAMITRLDRGVGRIIDLLDELKLSDNTLVIFTSDNGPITAGGQDPECFDSNGPLRDQKLMLEAWRVGGIPTRRQKEEKVLMLNPLDTYP